MLVALGVLAREVVQVNALSLVLPDITEESNLHVRRLPHLIRPLLSRCELALKRFAAF